MDSNTFMFNVIASFLAALLFETCKFLLKPSNRERIRAKLCTVWRFCCVEARGTIRFVIGRVLIAWSFWLDYAVRQTAQVASYLLMLFSHLVSRIEAVFNQCYFTVLTGNSPVARDQLSYHTEALTDKIIQKLISLGASSAAGLAGEIGRGVRADDLIPLLESLVASGVLQFKESGEPGCWRGFKTYGLAM